MSFSQFYQKVNIIYKCFGVAPWKFEEITGSKIPWFFAIGLLSGYWIFLGSHLMGNENGADQISSIVNFIQLFLNGLAFSTTIISTAYNQKPFQRMLKYLDSIDEQLSSSGCPINYKNQSPVFYGGLLLFFIVLILQGGIEVFVFVMNSPKVSLTYWIVHMVPFLVYGLCVQQSIFIIYCILLRCRKVHDLLTRKNPSTNTSIVRSGTALKVHVTPSSRSCPDQGDTIKVIYKLAVSIDELCDRVNRYFGLTFLTSLLAIFAVTSIQGFHCFRIFKDLDNKNNRNWWTFATAVITVVVNTLLVAVLAFISDMVTSKAGSISTSVRNRKLDDEKTIQYSSWFHPVLINIKISAFGFFDINCLMLCAFISAWVTYLLILVQFNEIGGSPNQPQFNFGKL